MEKHNAGQQLCQVLATFFREFDAETREQLLWDWVTAYIHSRAEIINGKDASESLFFYEQLTETFTRLEAALQQTEHQNTNT